MAQNNMKFKGWLAENGVTQREIATLLDISISNVNAKVNGKQPWTLQQVKSICQHFNLSADIYFV